MGYVRKKNYDHAIADCTQALKLGLHDPRCITATVLGTTPRGTMTGP
jgi:hypothetical protein